MGNYTKGKVCWLTLSTPALGRLKQEDYYGCEASLGCRMRLCLKNHEGVSTYIYIINQ